MVKKISFTELFFVINNHNVSTYFRDSGRRFTTVGWCDNTCSAQQLYNCLTPLPIRDFNSCFTLLIFKDYDL